MADLFLFDFDGVLVSSHREVALTAFNGQDGDLFVRTLEELPDSYLDLFLANSRLPRNASELHCLGEWTVKRLSASLDLSFPSFLEARLSEDQRFSERRHLFFGARAKLIEEDNGAWCALTKPYQAIWSLFQGLPPESRFIVTNKNAKAVEALTTFYDAELPVKNLCSGDNNLPKSEHIRALATGREFGSIHFIDDSLRNLREVREACADLADLHLYQATWCFEEFSLSEEEYTSFVADPEREQGMIALLSQATCSELIRER